MPLRLRHLSWRPGSRMLFPVSRRLCALGVVGQVTVSTRRVSPDSREMREKLFLGERQINGVQRLAHLSNLLRVAPFSWLLARITLDMMLAPTAGRASNDPAGRSLQVGCECGET